MICYLQKLSQKVPEEDVVKELYSLGFAHTRLYFKTNKPPLDL